jgi:hypothetical protein
MFIIEFVTEGIGAAAFDVLPLVGANGQPREFASVPEALGWLTYAHRQMRLDAQTLVQLVIRRKDIES